MLKDKNKEKKYIAHYRFFPGRSLTALNMLPVLLPFLMLYPQRKKESVGGMFLCQKLLKTFLNRCLMFNCSKYVNAENDHLKLQIMCTKYFLEIGIILFSFK